MAQVGQWRIEGAVIHAVDRRGALEYELSVPAADLFQLEIEGVSAQPLDLDPGFYLIISVDGERVGRVLLDAGFGQPGSARVLTP